MRRKKKIILCFVAFYLPGFKSGGPVRSVSNLVDCLGDEFEFRIVTSDRDFQDQHAYPGIVPDAWNSVDGTSVFYASPRGLSFRSLTAILRETEYDLVYINSFFSLWFSVIPILLRKLRVVPQVPCVLAPRGELSVGALSIKSVRKKVYIRLSRLLGFFSDVDWQCTSEGERYDVSREITSSLRRVHFSPNVIYSSGSLHKTFSRRAEGPPRLVFLSRISRKKNLDFLLRVLKKVSADLVVSIYGPREDLKYWQTCQSLIDSLPEHVKVVVGGSVQNSRVAEVFSQNDLFVFPTLGENFGHVIFESLAAGTPVLVSDQTGWVADKSRAVQILPLVESQWVDALNGLGRLRPDDWERRRREVVHYVGAYLEQDRSMGLSRAVFNLAGQESN
jgi:glycosyltransferase involved in cell wall biosynthesis